MPHAPEDLLSQATYRMRQPGTISVSDVKPQTGRLCVYTSPSDFMIKVHVPINRRMTNPPSTVLISGIPLCFAYGAYSITKMLAEMPKTTLETK